MVTTQDGYELLGSVYIEDIAKKIEVYMPKVGQIIDEKIDITLIAKGDVKEMARYIALSCGLTLDDIRSWNLNDYTKVMVLVGDGLSKL